MNVIANGSARSVDDGATVESFVRSLGWKPEWVVVERNGEPVERARIGEIRLREGDRLEVVRAVAGG